MDNAPIKLAGRPEPRSEELEVRCKARGDLRFAIEDMSEPRLMFMRGVGRL